MPNQKENTQVNWLLNGAYKVLVVSLLGMASFLVNNLIDGVAGNTEKLIEIDKKVSVVETNQVFEKEKIEKLEDGQEKLKDRIRTLEMR